MLNPPGEKKYLRDHYCSHISKGTYYWPPYDLLAISGILTRHAELSAIDAIGTNMSEAKCLNKIKNLIPDFIFVLTGVVSRCNDESFIQTIKHELPATKIIITGDFLLDEKENYFKKNNSIDAILLDFTTHDIVNYINNISYSSTNSLLVKGKATHDKQPSTSEFKIGLPRHDLFDKKLHSLPHIKNHPLATILTSLGCPYFCYFCQQEKTPYKLRDLDEVFEELKYFHQSGYKEIWFKDQSFGANSKHLISICNKIIEEGYKFSWSCEIRADNISEEKLNIMKNSGCHSVFIGVETPNQEILEKFNKKISLEQTIKAFKLCKKLKIKTIAHFIIGLPGETEESIHKLIKFAIKLDPFYCAFNIATPPPNSSFKTMALKNGWIDDSINTFDNSVSFPILETKHLSSEQLWNLKKRADRKFFLRYDYFMKQLRDVNSLTVLINKLKNFSQYFTHHFS